MVAAANKTAAYPKATIHNCTFHEMEFTKVFYRKVGQGYAMESL